MDIPSNVIEIGERAFAGCENLTEVVIPNGVLLIGEMAFKKSSKLTKVSLPTSIVHVGDEAFAGCPCESELKKKQPHLFP